MGSEKKVTKWAEDIKKVIQRMTSSGGIDYPELYLYNIERWGFSEGQLKSYLEALETKGFIKKAGSLYKWNGMINLKELASQVSDEDKERIVKELADELEKEQEDNSDVS